MEVDLHLLYQQVTALGGLEPVIQRKQWVVACEPFNFPSSFTNKSFVIRKLYVGLLHHYEQVYYHRRTGLIVPSPKGLAEQMQAAADKEKRQRGVPCLFPPVPRASDLHQAHSDGSDSPASPASRGCGGDELPVGTRFVGTIDSHFDKGFYITISLPGGRTMQAVMYQTSPIQSEYKRLYPHPHYEYASTPNDFESKKLKLSRNAGGTYFSRPKQACSAFNFFTAKNSLEAKSLNPSADLKTISRLMGERWQQLTAEQREPYNEQAQRDKERYDRELAELCKAQGMMPGSPSEDAADTLVLGGSAGGLQDLLHGNHEASTPDAAPQPELMHHHMHQAGGYDGMRHHNPYPYPYPFPAYDAYHPSGHPAKAYPGQMEPYGHPDPHGLHEDYEHADPHDYEHTVYHHAVDGEQEPYHPPTMSYQKSSTASYHLPPSSGDLQHLVKTGGPSICVVIIN